MQSSQRIFVLWCLLCCYWKQVCGQDFNPLPRSQRPLRPVVRTVTPRSLTPNAVRQAFQDATRIVTERRQTVTPRGRPIDPRTDAPSFRHNMFQRSRPRTQQLENNQQRFEEATRILLADQNLTPEQVNTVLAEMDLSRVLRDNIVEDCIRMFNFTCNPTERYRSFDGTCNNLANPSWGMAGSCFQRLLLPVYADGISEMRRAVSGRELPRPRTISLEIHAHMDRPTDYVTHMFMQWGQFLDHDISLSPLEQNQNQPLNCCPPSVNNSRECGPILLDRDDPFYAAFGIDCLNNARTVICSSCRMGARQQTDQLTAFIDGSMIYDIARDEAGALRTRDGSGTLRSLNTANGGELLPDNTDPNVEDGCSFQMQERNCFVAGDIRVNQHPALTSFHTIFLRQHNRLARRLQSINPRWDDERLYQEARRIIGAQLQMITYNEFLPLVIGPERMRYYDLYLQPGTGQTGYDPTVEPTLMNEFSTAAFRFGHSLINSYFTEFTRQSGPSDGNRLRDIFLWPFGLYNGQIERIVQGLARSPAQKFDRHMVRDVTNHLYQLRSNQSGLDLASLNVFRGRDHGIPPYVDVVRFCGGPDIGTFPQLDRLFQRGYRQRFQSVYESVEDIDLFSGGLAERPNQGAVIGPTFTCIVGIQFYHLKYGDRFYFEHGGEVGSFTPDQVRELRKTTFAKVICENSEIDTLQKNVMMKLSSKNREMSCEDLPDIDLNYWRE